MKIQEIMQVQPITQVTQEHVNTMQNLVDSNYRAEAYLYYAQLIGNQNPEATQQLMIQAQITTYSGVIGGSALEGNFNAKIHNQNDYNLRLDDFSKHIIEGMITAIKNDIESPQNPGTGLLNANQIQQADQNVWASKNMEKYFPGNFQLSLDPWQNTEEAGTSKIDDILLLGQAGLRGSMLGKRFSDFPDTDYDTVIHNGMTWMVNKQTGLIEGAFPGVSIGGIDTLASVANKQLFPCIGSMMPSADIIRLEKWKYLGANGKSGPSIYDSMNGLTPGSPLFKAIPKNNERQMQDEWNKCLMYVAVLNRELIKYNPMLLFNDLKFITSQGDPHFTTQDKSLGWKWNADNTGFLSIPGIRYDDQMPGERVLLKGTGVNDTFEIQARHELWRGGAQVSTTNTVAMRVDGEYRSHPQTPG